MTALGLTATSRHPERAGVQMELMELLIAHGAMIEGPQSGAVVSCLRNGRGRAAEFLAKRGARLNLEGAAGVGRLDLVRELFPSATKQEVKDGVAGNAIGFEGRAVRRHAFGLGDVWAG